MDPTTPAPDPGRKPDAILFPTGWQPPGPAAAGNRTHRLCLHFEQLLGAQAGQKAHIRSVPGDLWMASLSPHDTLLHPEDHPRSKFPRYDWEPQGNGLMFGHLKQEPA